MSSNPFQAGSSSNSNNNNNQPTRGAGGPVRSESLNKRLNRITSSQSTTDSNIEDLRERVSALEAENRMFRQIITQAYPNQWALLKMQTKKLCDLTPAEESLYLQSNPRGSASQHHGPHQTNLQQGSWGTLPQQPAILEPPPAPSSAAPTTALLSQQLAAAQALLAFDPQVNQLVANLAPHIGHQPTATSQTTTSSLPSLLQVRNIGSSSTLASTYANSTMLPNPSAGPIARSASNRGNIGEPTTSSKRSCDREPGNPEDNTNVANGINDPNKSALPGSDAGMKE